MKPIEEFTVQQTAQHLGVTLKYVRDLLYEGKLRGAYKTGRIWRIPARAVQEWRQSHAAHGVQR